MSVNTVHFVELKGRERQIIECCDHATMLWHVNKAKKLQTISVIRVTYPSGNVRTLGHDGAGWVGEVF